MNKCLLLFLIILFSTLSCEKEEVYFEYLFSEGDADNFYNKHYLYVGGDYDIKDSIFEKAACQYFDTVNFRTPISTIVFLKSKRGTEGYRRSKSINSIDFDRVESNELLSIVYDLGEEDSSGKCARVKYILYHTTGETLKQD